MKIDLIHLTLYHWQPAFQNFVTLEREIKDFQKFLAQCRTTTGKDTMFIHYIYIAFLILQEMLQSYPFQKFPKD